MSRGTILAHRPIRLRVAAAVALMAVAGRGGAQAGPADEGIPERGMLLVAKPKLRDPNFSQTVVLLLRAGEQGALGLVLNRPTDVTLAEMLPEMEELADRREPVYLGGPVDRTRMYLLVRSGEESADGRRVVDDVHVSESPGMLRRFATTEDSRFRLFAGYAGWAAGQLEAELLRNDWFLIPGRSDLILTDSPEELWRRVLPREGTDWSRHTPAPHTGGPPLPARPSS